MSNLNPKNVIDELLKTFESQNKIYKLNTVETLNEWHLQSFKNLNENGKFSIIRMSDGNLYLNRHERKQRLELIQTNSDSKIYRLENEPFGWNYIYGHDGSLSLVDSEYNELINYKIAK